ncbi:hypothetical protein HYPSUDRAFT_62875 [Hypholoma sublateritium FD-334 SS-4]|uniref:Uncharacterized protein n=1 Tax=Hypholoma sublateritium (strain FD-334 SS-4) TaxID=945553 RepID=A0A0D2MV17_HYPSF|nr:hypothetical protein HYPSUDRAFT_62875 [Hypholoma sublateritium FD-334 SS-4]
MALTPSLIALWHPRKPKQRATFVALILLACLTTYIFVANSASLSQSALRRSDAVHDQLALALETIQNARLADVSNKHSAKKAHHHVKLPSAKLNAAQELAAVTSFLASLPQNIIPHTVDPALPIDPQLVLDFDTRGPRAQDEINAMVEDVWLRNPVFLYSKVYSPPSREIKSILSQLYLRPESTIIDVDLREDVEILTPILKRLTGFSDLPLLIIGGKPIGSIEQVEALHKTGELQKMMTEAGALINGSKKKKNRK